MKKISFILFLSGLFFSGYAQFSATDSTQTTYFPRKFNIHFSVGSQFSSYTGYGYGLSTFISPSLTYDVSKRFQIRGGLSLITTNYSGIQSFLSEQGDSKSQGNYTSAFLYVSGTYLLNKNLTLSGMAFKEFPLAGDPLSFSPYQSYSKEGAQGIRMDVNYKIGENVQIQAGFGYSKGINPYMSPYGNSFLNSNNRYGLMPYW